MFAVFSETNKDDPMFCSLSNLEKGILKDSITSVNQRRGTSSTVKNHLNVRRHFTVIILALSLRSITLEKNRSALRTCVGVQF